jgi:hypothetical protein
MTRRTSIFIPKEVLLVEVERRCLAPDCGAKTLVGLTKEEARLYRGFECARCGRFWDDALAENDIPDWWQDLVVTGLSTLRGSRPGRGAGGAGEVVERMSEAYRGRDEGE